MLALVYLLFVYIYVNKHTSVVVGTFHVLFTIIMQLFDFQWKLNRCLYVQLWSIQDGFGLIIESNLTFVVSIFI